MPHSANWMKRHLRSRSASGGPRRNRTAQVAGVPHPPQALTPAPSTALQKEAAQRYSSFQVMYTVGYCLSLVALLLALAILLGLR